MTIHKSKNFSHKDPATIVNVQNNDSFERCNISQLIPNTVICNGKTGLTFTSCNLVNCSVPIDSIKEHCNTTQVSRCKHLHPEWTALPDEVENCSHVVNIDTLEPGSIVIYSRKDTVL